MQVIGIVGSETIVCTIQDNNGVIWKNPNGDYPKSSPYFLGSVEINGDIYFGSSMPRIGVYMYTFLFHGQREIRKFLC